MKALVFGSRPDRDEPRPVPTDELEQHLVSLPFGLHELDDARPIHPDWVVTRPILAGICGSDSKIATRVCRTVAESSTIRTLILRGLFIFSCVEKCCWPPGPTERLCRRYFRNAQEISVHLAEDDL